jgi:hypothetical protein
MSNADRLIRFCVACGFIHQTPSLEYQHTKFSQPYLSEPGPVNSLRFLYEFAYKPSMNLPTYVTEYQSQQKETRAQPHEPTSPEHNLITHFYGQDGVNAFGILAQYPRYMRDAQMTFSAAAIFEQPITGIFDFASLIGGSGDDGRRVTLVDIGGGFGQAIGAILKGHPQLDPSRFVLQDRPEVVAQVKEVGVLPPEVRIEEFDFWGPQSVKGAKAYYLRRVLHDYADEGCVKILRHTREAMADYSVVLISDMVMPEKFDETTLLASSLDQVMIALGGKERTEEGFRMLLAEAGLELVKVWRKDPRLINCCLIEARKAKS